MKTTFFLQLMPQPGTTVFRKDQATPSVHRDDLYHYHVDIEPPMDASFSQLYHLEFEVYGALKSYAAFLDDIKLHQQPCINVGTVFVFQSLDHS